MRHFHLGHYAVCTAIATLAAGVFVVGDVPSTVLGLLAVALTAPLVLLLASQHSRHTPRG